MTRQLVVLAAAAAIGLMGLVGCDSNDRDNDRGNSQNTPGRMNGSYDRSSSSGSGTYQGSGSTSGNGSMSGSGSMNGTGSGTSR